MRRRRAALKRTALRAVLAAFAALWLLPAAAQAIYKWVDENGVTHFSESPPPPGAKGGKIDVKPVPPSSDRASDDPATWKERARALEQQRHQRESAEDGARMLARQDREARCRKAKGALDQLENARRLYTLEKGEKRYIGDDERAAQAERMKKTIAESC
jgi:hypothetical protein